MKRSLFKRYAAPCIVCVLVCLFSACPNAGISSQNGYSNIAGIHITILDSVGGTPVREATALTVYRAGTKTLMYAPTLVVNGSVRLYLPKNECYDLYLSGKKDRLAASVIENYWVKDADEQSLTMFQRAVQIGAQTQSPSITSVKLNGFDFADGGVWAGAKNQPMKLAIVFHSPSRAIQSVPSNGNFGCAVAVGASASSRNNIASVSPLCVRMPDGSWQCTAEFSFDKISFPNEINDFIITAYDVAGNRVERHINSIEFKERRPGLKSMTGARIKKFRVEMHRFPHSLKLFNMPEKSPLKPFAVKPHNGESNTYEVQLWFQIKDSASQDLPIRGFNIYRRVQGQADWIFVGRKQYANDYIGEHNPQFPAYNGFHLGYDTDSALQEGVTYEYKVSPFIDSTHSLDSPTATARLLPACTIELENPSDNGFVKKSELNDLSFSFRITNPDMWNKKQADTFSFGLFIAEKTSDQKILFAGKAAFSLKAPAGERLSLQALSSSPRMLSLKELKQRNLIDSSVTEDDLISYSNGVVTIKPGYLKTKEFNHPHFKDKVFQTGYTYAWDIFDWGKDPQSVYDDEPAAFKSTWQSKDADGNEIPYPTEPLSSSESFANGLRYAGSLNGQYYFKVTDE
uniref:PrcAII n=1 Tax=Treponema sp. OMZ 839 TaxID=244312 RepID=Q6UKM2_9SPIR|nr:PrcAII [Treponema sp. OMZ 839]